MRKTLIALIVGLLAGLVLVLAVDARVQASPFDRDQPVQPYQPPASGAGAEPGGVFAPITRALVAAQREAALALNHALADIRAGGGGGLAWGLLVAFLYGGFHAAGPGHGKAVVVSYFLSTRARPWRGVMLGLSIALAHVGSAILVVASARLVMGQALPASLEDMRGVKLASYLVIVAIGAWLFVDAWRRRGATKSCCAHHHSGHDHDHHDHDHDHDHDQGGGNWSARWRDRAVGALLGAVPCTGAILVLLFALANGLWIEGLLLVMAIGVGMAVAMGLLGLATVLARRRLTAWAGRDEGRGHLARALDFAGPLFVMIFGAALFAVTY